jgi:hypothetical protein
MSDAPGPSVARRATPADVDAVTAAFTTAFFNDPVWAPVFPDESRRAEQSAPMWRVYAVAALRYPWTFVTPGAEAAAVWIPPGGTELTGEETRRLGEVIEEAAGPEAAASAREIEARLEAGHPGGSFFHLLTSLTLPARSRASCPSAGLTMRQGPHHGARRPVTTGILATSATGITLREEYSTR